MKDEQIEILKEIKVILKDLIYINGIIATELVKITENTAAIRHGEEFLNSSPCISEHEILNKKIIEKVKKFTSSKDHQVLEKHVLKHLE
ncbi:MAG: hypothetical protein EU539_02030 [Promethearchaeota archaeon]|nr:MAG: hypothetical protein EU539_02030 [Candidatus Lokiarchaeota archaeon]